MNPVLIMVEKDGVTESMLVPVLWSSTDLIFKIHACVGNEKQFSITHVLTGRQLITTETESEALKILRILDSHFPCYDHNADDQARTMKWFVRGYEDHRSGDCSVCGKIKHECLWQQTFNINFNKEN